jgi:dienelactone hydrolase
MARSLGKRTTVAVAAGLLVLAGGATPAAAAGGDDPPRLLRPTGPNAVGASSIHLNDTSRPDPWVPEATRELMVTVWYPTRSTSGERAPYMTPEESRLIMERTEQAAGLPPDTLSTVRTNAYAGAKPTGRPHSLPLVVLSPGYTQPRSSLSGLAEDLASHGYVVAAIDHTYETYAVTFPDGRIATCEACDLTEDSAFFTKLNQGRAADVSFVLDQLTGPNSHRKWPVSNLIDAARIGMSGHSAGGASSIVSMLNDDRIDAGIDMDGRTYIPATGLSRPFMFLGQGTRTPGTVDSWDRDWALMAGWKRWLTVDGTVHASFNDMSLLAEQLGIDLGASTGGTRSMEITRRYTLAMFDQHLRHRPQPLLDRPSRCYPEVTIAAR